ncbi:hypothetical protein RhiJN_18643 [Ceratobasidium sp. AG-Ba]|nr:hypothetical protein RhiJN_18643 [Ceratobasidium sp. AG-Ba]
MPAADPADQSTAREYEQMLRYYVYLGRAPQSKLDWFQSLPKRVRHSCRLIDEALGPIEAAETQAREALAERQARELEQTLRLAAARKQPRDLLCLQGPGNAWHGIGRCKKRRCVFNAIGRAYIRQMLASSTPSHNAPILTVKTTAPPSPPPTHNTPTRPITPEGLCEAAFSCVGLLATVSGINAYGTNTPCPMPPVPTRIIRRPLSPVLPPAPQPAYDGKTVVDGVDVDWRPAYVIAHGRHERFPHRPTVSLHKAARNVLDTDLLYPGALDHLSALFFPYGFDNWTLARLCYMYLADFCAGWYALALDRW